MQKVYQKISHDQNIKSQNLSLLEEGRSSALHPRSSAPHAFVEISFSVFSVFVYRNRVNLMLIFYNFSPPFQRQYPLAKTTSGSKRTSGNPRAELEYLPVCRESSSGLRIGCFLSQTCLEFRVLRRSKAGFWKLRKLQNCAFSGTIPRVGNPETFSKIF